MSFSIHRSKTAKTINNFQAIATNMPFRMATRTSLYITRKSGKSMTTKRHCFNLTFFASYQDKNLSHKSILNKYLQNVEIPCKHRGLKSKVMEIWLSVLLYRRLPFATLTMVSRYTLTGVVFEERLLPIVDKRPFRRNCQ